jgi:hypothetical protein
MAGAGDDPHARLRASGLAYTRFAVANPGPYNLMFRPDRCDPADPDLKAASYAAFDQLLAAVRDAQGAGWRADDDTAELAGVIWASVHGIASLTIQGSLPTVVARNGGDTDLTHLVDLIQDLLGNRATVTASGGEP